MRYVWYRSMCVCVCVCVDACVYLCKGLLKYMWRYICVVLCRRRGRGYIRRVVLTCSVLLPSPGDAGWATITSAASSLRDWDCIECAELSMFCSGASFNSAKGPPPSHHLIFQMEVLLSHCDDGSPPPTDCSAQHAWGTGGWAEEEGGGGQEHSAMHWRSLTC